MMTRQEAMIRVENNLDDNEWMHAQQMAKYLVRRSGYWLALYNVMTLMIHCHHRHFVHWSQDELDCVNFLWAVRNIIYKNGF